MSEWTIEIETAPGVTTDDEVLATIHDALNSDAAALGASVSCNIRAESVSAIYQVEAPSLREAVDAGLDAFMRALAVVEIDDPGGSVRAAPYRPKGDPKRYRREAVPA
jgi:hypothetical protein